MTDWIYQDISHLQTTTHLLFNLFQCLQVTVPMVRSPLLCDSKRSGSLVVFPWLDSTDLKSERPDAYLEPNWDTEPPIQDSITCGFPTKGTHSRQYLRPSMIGLLLTNHWSYYERVGCLVHSRRVGPREDHWTSKLLTKGLRGTLGYIEGLDMRFSERNKLDPI
jgi:hypothetical protein